MAWISSKIRQPAAAQRSQFVYKVNLSPDKKQRENTLTYPLSDTIGVVTPLMVRGQHLLQHQQHTGDQTFVLSAAELTL